MNSEAKPVAWETWNDGQCFGIDRVPLTNHHKYSSWEQRPLYYNPDPEAVAMRQSLKRLTAGFTEQECSAVMERGLADSLANSLREAVQVMLGETCVCTEHVECHRCISIRLWRQPLAAYDIRRRAG